MTQYQDPEVNFDTVLDAWTDLDPDPRAMEQVTALMVQGVTMAQRPHTPEPTEAHFRLLTYVWGCIALGGFLARHHLINWFALNPVLSGLLVVFGCLCLIAPLLLLPILWKSEERRSSPC